MGSGAEAGLGIFIVLIWLVFMVVALGGSVFWIWQLIKVLTIPETQFRAAGVEKVTWGLVVGLLGWLGALIWFFGPRQRVLAAPSSAPLTASAAGWFPDPSGSGRLRWFDGQRWTDQLG